MNNWEELSMSQKADLFKIYAAGGFTSLGSIKEHYNKFADGGAIHIKPENRGKFTELKERTGHSATWFKNNGTPAQKKMATFTLNASKWKHADGGYLDNPTTKPFWKFAKGGILPEIRQRLYDNVIPYSYGNKLSRVKDAILRNEGDYKNIDGYTDRDALWAEYLQIPEDKRHKVSNAVRLENSDKTPSIRSDKKASQYRKISNLNDYDKRVLMELSSGLNVGDNRVATAGLTKLESLGKFTIGKGVDNNGEYVSYYDKWDLSPFHIGKKDQSLGIGKPIEIYDRIYLDDYYGVNSKNIPSDSYYGGYLQPSVIISPNTKYKDIRDKFAQGGPLSSALFKPFSYTPIPQVRYDDGGFKNSVELTDSVDYPHTFTTYDLFGTKPTRINESPALSKEQIVNLAWQAENPSNKGLNSNGTYSKYPDPSGKKDSKGNPLYDVGPGILVGTSISEKPFYTKAELDEGAYNYGLKGLSKIEKSYNEVYGNGEFDKVDPSLKLIMLDTRYRAGALPQAKYPNLYQAVHDRDTIKALQESRTTFIDRNNRKVPDNDRVRRLAEHLYPGMFDITFDSKGAHILRK